MQNLFPFYVLKMNFKKSITQGRMMAGCLKIMITVTVEAMGLYSSENTGPLWF